MPKRSKKKESSEFFFCVEPGTNLEKLKTHYKGLWKDHARAKRVKEGSNIFDTASEIHPDLVKIPPTSFGKWKKTLITKTPIGRHVPYGYISLGTRYGNPVIAKEGYYYRAGLAADLGVLHQMNSRILIHQGLTILNLKENEVAIAVNEVETQVCYGPDQFIFLQPWILAGKLDKEGMMKDQVVDLMSLDKKTYEFKYNGSVRGLAFHVSKGEVALIQVNGDDDHTIQPYGPGHQVITADTGARFLKRIDMRDTEISTKVSTRTKNGTQITLPVTLSLQVMDPIAYYISKRKSPLDVIDNALDKAVAKFCSRYDLNHLRGFNVKTKESTKGPKSIYDVIAEIILHDEDVIRLSTKHGVRVSDVVIGTFKLDKKAKTIVDKAANEELELQNALRQTELKKQAADSIYKVEERERELEKKKVDKEAEIRRAKKMHHIYLEKEEAEEKAHIRKIKAEGVAESTLIKAEAKAEASLKEWKALLAIIEESGDNADFVKQRVFKEIESKTIVNGLGKVEKMIMDPKLGAKTLLQFGSHE